MVNAIIPCAGYGTRMNMKSNESKEMLPNLWNTGPLIDYSLGLCQSHGMHPVVITRKEKKDLIDYCNKRGVETLIVEPVGEWSATVFASSICWEDHNVLLLPDTVFNPHDCILDIKTGLELGNDAVFALHKVDDISKWGSIENYCVTEKSDEVKPGYAWGTIGFTREYGLTLFSAMSTRNKPLKLRNVGFTYIEDFRDITRTGKVEWNVNV